LRIVVDLQGAQSTGSRSRGIGRYSLAVANAGTDEIWVALSGFYPDSIEPLRAEFDLLLPQRQIVVWQAPGPVAKLEPSSQWRMEAGELVREAFLAGLKPDVVHVSSLFEGLTDEVLTSIGSFDSMLATAVTLYDLIPLVDREHYLADAMVEAWYERKLGHLRRAQLWLAISESSRREAIDRLGLPAEWVVNISTAADASFKPVVFTDDERRRVTKRYALTRPFLLYTGGIDRRKNIEGLIGAYAGLPPPIRRSHQLAIVCSATNDQIARLKRLARQRGLAADEVVVTGFVPDTDLVALYNLCKAFVFPSWHEGFGLPALEAMSCGAAVIGANTSSVPEVIGRNDALFDPHDEPAITTKLNEVLTNEGFRQSLRLHAIPQAGKFSWERTARDALGAMDRLYRCGKSADQTPQRAPPRRPRLAYVSPLPGERSGIADYSAELLPELARHYDIDVIVNQSEVLDPWVRANIIVRSAEWFDRNAGLYDRVLYHFGNSTFHAHMFEMLAQHPGVVVLHDFFLSGVLAQMEWTGRAPQAWSRALFDSHGYRAIGERFAAPDPTDIVLKYPANLSVLQQADGVIVHSSFSRTLADGWYGAGYAGDWTVIPLLRSLPAATSRERAKVSLGFREDALLVCSFGVMGPTKLNHRLLTAWLASPLAGDERCHLVFVGEKDTGSYGRAFEDQVALSAARRRIHVTGFAPPELYRRYIAAADTAVQLRAHSRGETSRAVVDCMAYGLPTIVNVIGAATELPEDCVARLPAEFTDQALQELLAHLMLDRAEAATIGKRAAAHVGVAHSPRDVADRYRLAIERYARTGTRSRGERLARRIARLDAVTPPTEQDWLTLARCIARNEGTAPERPRQWLHNIGENAQAVDGSVADQMTLAWLAEAPGAFRVEPVFLDGAIYRYARKATAGLLRIDPSWWQDEPLETRPGDVLVTVDSSVYATAPSREIYESMRRQGVGLHFVVPDAWTADLGASSRAEHRMAAWLAILAELADGLICGSSAAAERLAAQIDRLQPPRRRPLKIGWVTSMPNGESPDPKRIGAIIVEDHWLLSWTLGVGTAPWTAAHGFSPDQGPPDRDDRHRDLPLTSTSETGLQPASDSGVAIDDLLTLIYGINGHLTSDVRRKIREAVGKSVITTVADVRSITMAMDRQTFPTPVIVRFAGSDLRSAVINGISFPVDQHDISVSVPGSAAGSWEPHLINCFRRICRRGSIAFDIGANVGYHTLMLAQLVGAEGTCYAFEPNSENCRLILLGAEQNGFDNVKLMPIALSDQQGWAYFSPHIGSNGGFASLNAELSDGCGVVVPTFMLDDLRLPPPDMIKIDVEGAEYRVLKGAEKSIGRSRPTIISEFSLEMTSRVSGVSGAQYLEWIAALQYDIFLLDRVTSQLVSIPSASSFLSAWGSRIEDLLFVPREKSHLIASN
jgi:FkbM family methyltransferase